MHNILGKSLVLKGTPFDNIHVCILAKILQLILLFLELPRSKKFKAGTTLQNTFHFILVLRKLVNFF